MDSDSSNYSDSDIEMSEEEIEPEYVEDSDDNYNEEMNLILKKQQEQLMQTDSIDTLPSKYEQFIQAEKKIKVIQEKNLEKKELDKITNDNKKHYSIKEFNELNNKKSKWVSKRMQSKKKVNIRRRFNPRPYNLYANKKQQQKMNKLNQNEFPELS